MMRVLLTGGSGFLGAHCVDCLLRCGHSVVFTVRSNEKGESILSNHPQVPPTELSYVIVEDIARENAFDEAVTSSPSFEAAIHTASPYHFRVTDRQKDLLDPAILGTINLLKALKKHAPTVRRVAITSSFAAMVKVNSHPKVYDESYWNDTTLHDALTTDLFTAWRGSKTFAEKAAWDFVADEAPNFQLSTVNPPIMYGPLRHHVSSLDALNTSNLRIRDLIRGKMRAGPLPPTGIYTWVDVRDAALAHVRAVTLPAAAGQRFLCAAGLYANAEIVDAVRKHFPGLREKLPLEYASDLDVRRKPFDVDNARSREVLGLEYRGIEESVVDAVKSFLAVGA